MARVAIMQLASCWGCNQSLVDSSLTLLHVLPELDFVYWPAVVDFKLHDLENCEDKSVDVGFLEGFIRTENDLKNAKLMEQKCKILVAMGSCAVMGGCPGLANLYSIEELTQRKFMDTEFVDEGSQVPTINVPKFVEAIPDLHKVVKIDVDLPGCPPKSGNIVGLIAHVLGTATTSVNAEKSMCDVCPLENCMLNDNTICYGSITSAGDPIGKLASGYPVLGEFGLTKMVHETNVMKLFNLLNQKSLSKTEVSQAVETLMMTLSSTPLGFLVTTSHPLLTAKMNPNMKTVNDIQIVDYTVEGYPEMVNNVIGAIMAKIKDDTHFEGGPPTVCTSCELNVEPKKVEKYIRDYVGIPDKNKCLLVQGYVCMGPITRAGCGATCIRANSPCLGCYGPALNVPDYAAKAMSLFPSLSSESPEDLKKFFLDPAGLFGRFCIPTSTLGNKLDDKTGGGN